MPRLINLANYSGTTITEDWLYTKRMTLIADKISEMIEEDGNTN